MSTATAISTQKPGHASLLQEHLNSEADDPDKRKPFRRNVTASKATAPRSSSPAATSSAVTSGQTLALQETAAAAGGSESPADQSAPLQQTKADQEPGGLDPLGISGGSERYPETVEALRDLCNLRGKFSRLQARVVELEEGKLDQSQLTHITELIANQGTQMLPFCKSNLHEKLECNAVLIYSADLMLFCSSRISGFIK